jgi:glycosyltransferase involved in cell wall biosynthesis
MGEDTELISRITYAGYSTAHCLDETYYIRRIHGGNISLTVESPDFPELKKRLQLNFMQFMLKNKSSVSVIIPVRNGEKYLKESIESIHKQNFCLPVEIIVVDDGSTDNSGEIARQLGCRVIAIPASGAIKARNIGLRESQGDLVIFHDADDVMTPDSLSQLYEALQADTQAQAVFAKRRDFVSPELSEEEKARISPKPEAYFGAMAGCAIIRKTLFDTTGMFDETLDNAGEAMAWILKLQDMKIPVVRLDYTAVFRRLHNTNMGVTSKKQEYADYLKILMHRRQQQ